MILFGELNYFVLALSIMLHLDVSDPDKTVGRSFELGGKATHQSPA